MVDSKKTVLVVDDDEDILVFLEDLLESESLHSIVAKDGKTAIELAKSKHPDLILLDIMMPEMDGHEVCKLLKADPATSDISIVMITAKNDVRDVGLSLGEGADGFLAKPFDTEHLLRLVQSKLQGETIAFYSQNEAVNVSESICEHAGEGPIVFIDILEPKLRGSCVYPATEIDGVDLITMSQLSRGENSVETTMLVCCASPSAFGDLINCLQATEGVEILGCRVYVEDENVRSHMLDMPPRM